MGKKILGRELTRPEFSLGLVQVVKIFSFRYCSISIIFGNYCPYIN